MSIDTDLKTIGQALAATYDEDGQILKAYVRVVKEIKKNKAVT